jgi:hypothetical protein
MTREQKFEAALKRIADGQFANAFHDGHCLCHRCAMPPGELRQIAQRALDE